MSQRQNTRVLGKMTENLEDLDPQSDRYKVLSVAKRFKASWLELGEALHQVKSQGLYQSWGFSSFEVYCKKELHIRQDTALKLTRSFAFLREHEPDVLKNAASKELPSLDVVDLLSRVQEERQVADGDLESLKQQVFRGDQGIATRQDLLKKIKETYPNVTKDTTKAREATAHENDLRKALFLAERLESLLELQGGDLSQDVLKSTRHIVRELKRCFQAQKEQGAA